MQFLPQGKINYIGLAVKYKKILPNFFNTLHAIGVSEEMIRVGHEGSKIAFLQSTKGVK